MMYQSSKKFCSTLGKFDSLKIQVCTDVEKYSGSSFFLACSQPDLSQGLKAHTKSIHSSDF